MRKETALTGMITSMMFWGFANPFSDLAMDKYTPVQTYFVETTAGIAMFLLIVLLVPQFRVRVRNIPWRLAIPLGLIMPGLCFYLGNIGYEYGTVTTGAILLASEAIFTAIFGTFVLKEYLSVKAMLTVVMGMVGVIIVGISGSHTNPEVLNKTVSVFGHEFSAAVVGATAFIVSAMFSGLYAVYVRKNMGHVDPVSFTVGQLASATLAGWPMLYFSDETLRGTYADHTSFAAAMTAGFLGSAFAFLLFNLASEHVTARQTGITLNTIPVFAIILGALIGRGIPTMTQILGAGIVLASLFFLETDAEA